MRLFVLVFGLPLAMASAPSWGQGGPARADADAAAIFGSTCSFCHQGGGRRTSGMGPLLMGTMRSDDFIVNRIKNGSEGKMPAFGGQLTDAQIRALVRYIRDLKPEQ